MSGRATGGPSRGADAPTRTTWTRDGVGAIVVVLALGLAFRLIIAYRLPGSGFEVDLISFRAWAGNLARDGLGGFYERDFFHDYTPGYLYVLYLVGVAAPWLGGPIGDLIKIPPILADLAIGWLVWSMVRELGGRGWAPLLAAALAVANPISWFDSVVWGQVDSFGVVFLLLGVRELWRDRPERAAILTVVAALIKPQLGILAFLVAAVTIRRALWPPDPDRAELDDPGPRAPLLDRIRAFERWTGHPVRILTTGLAGFLTAVVLCWPFGLSVLEPGRDGAPFHSGLVEQVFKTAGGYPLLSVNAYNPWALAEVDGNGIAANRGWVCDAPLETLTSPPCGVALTFGPVPAVAVGAGLAALAFLAICLAVARRPDALTILVGLALLAIAFFVLPTRVHERYLYPFFALGAILAAFSWRWLVAYLALSAATIANMYVVLTTIYAQNPGIVDWLAIGPTLASTPWVTIAALTNLGAAIWAFSQLRRDARLTLADEVAARSDDDEAGWASREPRPRPAPAFAGADAGPDRRQTPMAHPIAGRAVPTGGAAPFAAAAAVPALPRWSERPSMGEVGPWAWFRSRVLDRPVRADRSRGLDAEPGGRIDRLDVWVMVVLLVAVLGLRMFRLAEPYQMHFDEVYHARTATEFLQHWRYGISNDIYEYTHPHLAKYAMAGGLVAWGDDRVSATSELGVPVVDALIEPRRDDPAMPGGRGGDRLHLVTGSELRSYDLHDRGLIAAQPIAGATAIARDPVLQRLYVGTSNGEILTVELVGLDGVRQYSTTDLLQPPAAFARIEGSIRRLFSPGDGQTVIAATADDRLVTLDAATAEELGSVQLAGIADLAPGGSGPTLTAFPGSVANPQAAARALAEIIGGDAADYAERLASDADPIVIGAFSGSDERTAIDEAISDGRLAGIEIQTLPRVAVADADGVTFVAPTTGDVVASVPLDGGGHGLALITNVDDPKLYVTTGGQAQGAPGEVAIIAVGGESAKDGPGVPRTVPLPGSGTRVAYDEASQMVHVLGAAPADGRGTVIYVIEPHDPAVFADAVLPIEPTAWAIDVNKPYPAQDRQQILVFDGAGSTASIEIGKHAFAWRMPGVLAGAAMTVLLYALARILFRRRSIALFAAVAVLADGMLFVQSRIGMNDAYVGLGIVAAYTIFAALWMGAWRRRGAFWIGMPLIGICLGLALASKWVALYALGALGILILARSALGRFLVIVGMVGLTTVLGYIAINVPEGTGLGNLTFVAIMIGLTAVAVVVNVLHPIAWSLDEIRFAVAAPVAAAAAIVLVAIPTGRAGTALRLGPASMTPLEVALALVALALVAYVAFVAAGRFGFGPLAPPPDPTDPAALLPPPAPPPRLDWLRPGAQLGLPVVWMVICLVAVPVGLYIASYIPWALVDGHQIGFDWPPLAPGETLRQTLTDLTGSMYEYHNNLTAGHAASSPWWAWPFDLKPVWFYQEGLAGSTTAAVYDAGNIVVWWLGIPALAFVAWQAYARRSLPLALIAIGFACQWISWARIDRAAFQYHYYTSLPFVTLSLGYFLAELWHGASRRTWLLARLAAAAAILGPVTMWVLARPLCWYVGVDRVVTSSRACPPYIPEFVLTTQTLALAVVLGVAVLAVLRLLGTLQRPPSDGPADGGDARAWLGPMAPLVVVGLVSLAAVVLVRLVPDLPLLVWNGVPVEPVALIVALPLALLAIIVATARDARRFVVGVIVAIGAWFLVLYPNIAALPLPTTIANMYQGILPTYLYDFQFPVNTIDRSVPIQLFSLVPFALAAAMTLLCGVLAYSAWVWRLALAERDAADRDVSEMSGGVAPGAPGP